jgi:hypothetical protein
LLEASLILIYLVFMFGMPMATERVWIDSVSMVERERKAASSERAV